MADMQEYQKKAFDFANDLAKQIITLAVAIITLAVGNLERLAKVNHPYWLGATFIFYAISILFGLVALMFLSGHLDLINTNKYIDQENKPIVEKNNALPAGQTPFPLKPNVTVSDLSIYAPKIKFTMFIQVSAFGVAIFLTMIFAVLGLCQITPGPDKKVYLFQQVGPNDSLLLKGIRADSIYFKFNAAPGQSAGSNLPDTVN